MDVRKREDTVVGVVGHHDGLPCYIPLCADPKPPSTKYQGFQLWQSCGKQEIAHILKGLE